MAMTNQPIKKAMNKPEATKRLIQWAIELSQFDVVYCPKTAVKAQAVVDFITEFTLPDDEKAKDESERWTILTDGSLV